MPTLRSQIFKLYFRARNSRLPLDRPIPDQRETMDRRGLQLLPMAEGMLASSVDAFGVPSEWIDLREDTVGQGFSLSAWRRLFHRLLSIPSRLRLTNRQGLWLPCTTSRIPPRAGTPVSSRPARRPRRLQISLGPGLCARPHHYWRRIFRRRSHSRASANPAR